VEKRIFNIEYKFSNAIKHLLSGSITFSQQHEYTNIILYNVGNNVLFT